MCKMNKTYICIDLKSFYASVECRERGLDPLITNLVVADISRTEKTICLAVSPSLKQYGIPGRARLFEVISKLKKINYDRKTKIPYHKFIGKSYLDTELKKDSRLEIDYIAATPQMKKYMEYSVDIYNVYLKYLAPDDIFVYSIDEVFCDITNYLKTYNMTPQELVTKMIQDVYNETGITATAGIGTNLFLAKIAMDIMAKHVKPNEIGVRIAYLDESSYRKELWNHTPLTDFWRIGRGIAKKLEQNNLYTMGDIARCSINNENILYKLFGVNAELLIDHAWGYEPCTMKDIKSYKPSTNCLSTGQVLHCAYDYIKAKLIVREMVDSLVLDLVNKKKITDQLGLYIGYDIEYSSNEVEIVKDYYGRSVPKPTHSVVNLNYKTSSSKVITDAVMNVYDKIINKKLLVKRINISANNLIDEINTKPRIEQFNLFTDYELQDKKIKKEIIEQKDELELQKVVLDIKNKYGKNSILKAMNLEEGSTAKERNEQVGGHKG